MNNADIQHDLKNKDQPRTAFGFIVHALDARRQANEKPFTVMSCDNVQQNGEVAKNCILKFAKGLNNPELVEYIDTKVTFPNAMGKNKKIYLKKQFSLSLQIYSRPNYAGN
jgi:mannitol-1-phosphate/altronate dehydrogenase